MRALRIVILSSLTIAIGAMIATVLTIGQVRVFTASDGSPAYGPTDSSQMAILVFGVFSVVVVVSCLVYFFLRARDSRIRLGRLQGGCCCTCGYRLMAAQDICPECGSMARRARPVPKPSHPKTLRMKSDPEQSDAH